MAHLETLVGRKPNPLTRGGALDALRFLAAFCMVLHHYSAESPVKLATLHPVFERGYLATDFFLIVSGYVMARIYGARVADGRISSGEFFLRRALRFVPAHLMMVTAFVAVTLAAGLIGIAPNNPEWFQWKELPGQVALIQSFGPFGGKGWNAPAWSLSALLGCYFVFPMLWRLLRRIGSPAAAVFLGVATLAAFQLFTTQVLGYPVYQMPMNLGFIRALPLFVMGVCLAICSERTYVPPVVAGVLGLVSLGLLIGLQATGAHNWESLSLISLIVFCAGALPMKKPSKVLEKAALISFAVFITNEFVRVVYFGVDHAVSTRLGLSQHVEWLIWFGGPVAAVAFATAFHYLVDWPSQALIKAKVIPGIQGALAGLTLKPDPAFDPFGPNGGVRPRVREILLHGAPMVGSARRRPTAPTGVAWG